MLEAAIFYFVYPETRDLTVETTQLAFGEENAALKKRKDMEKVGSIEGREKGVERVECQTTKVAPK